jgi:hypothetical protein
MRESPKSTTRLTCSAEVRRRELIIHGDDDQIVPIDASANIVKDGVKLYPGAPHGLTHRDELNARPFRLHYPTFSTSLRDEDLVRLPLRRADPARSERGAVDHLLPGATSR